MDMAREIGDEDLEVDEEKEAESELDLPPEYCRYHDEGCEFSRSCLNCPFPRCLYDEPRGRQRWLKGMRNKEIAGLFSSGGWELKELALLFGVSRRTIQRALKSTLLLSSAKPAANSEESR